MSFVRSKKVNGREYFYLVESKREGGKVRQKTLAYLGKSDTVEGAITDLEYCIEYYKKSAERLRARALEAQESIPPVWMERNGNEIPKPNRSRKRALANAILRRYWVIFEGAAECDRKVMKANKRLDVLRQYV